MTGTREASNMGLRAPDVASPPDNLGRRPLVSIVTPAYCEVENLPRLHREITLALAGEDLTWELIIVDDGSLDSTWQGIVALREADPRVYGVRLSRNFGHQYALFAGLTHARGEAVISMDADLQHPPSVIPSLLREWRRGARIVHTLRVDPQELGHGLLVAVVDREAGDHLAHGEPGAVAPRLQAHEPVPDPRKRGEHHAVGHLDGPDPERRVQHAPEGSRG